MSYRFFHPKTVDDLNRPYHHLISVEIDAEIAKQFVECVEHQSHVKITDLHIPVMLAEELAEAIVRALEEDDA